MTPVIASSHHPPAGKPCFRRCIAVAPPPLKSRTTPSIMPNRLVDRRRGDELPTAIVNPLPTTPASAEPAGGRWAVCRLCGFNKAEAWVGDAFFGGFRTPAPSLQVHRSRPAGIRNPSRFRPFA